MKKYSPHRNTRTPSPAELRSMFGANLRQLASVAPSISALCRDLEINRTQFNRYLSGESFPRPDVLHRICSFFGVDARILLSPVAEIDDTRDSILRHPEVSEFLTSGDTVVSEDTFPSGIYRFTRRSFTQDDVYVQGLVYVYRKGTRCFIRGYEAKAALVAQGLPAKPHDREFRGVVLAQENGVSLLISRRNALTFSFSYLVPHASFQNNYWVGYTTRTAQESVTAHRAARLVFEHLGNRRGDILKAARSAGLREEKDLLPFHRTQIQPGTAFR